MGPIHSQIFIITHDQSTQQQCWLIRCSCAWPTSIAHHVLVSDCTCKQNGGSYFKVEIDTHHLYPRKLKGEECVFITIMKCYGRLWPQPPFWLLRMEDELLYFWIVSVQTSHTFFALHLLDDITCTWYKFTRKGYYPRCTTPLHVWGKILTFGL